MRNLTIKRRKTFVGCLAKLKVYIEDRSSTEIVINDIPCRLLGEIKNGEEQTFSIEEYPAKVFVIADKLSKNYCNDFYKLDYGNTDVNISGKCHYNPIAGNPFRFDNVTDEEVLNNRKKGNKKGCLFTLLFALIGIIFGFAIGFFL